MKYKGTELGVYSNGRIKIYISSKADREEFEENRQRIKAKLEFKLREVFNDLKSNQLALF